MLMITTTYILSSHNNRSGVAQKWKHRNRVQMKQQHRINNTNNIERTSNIWNKQQ